MQKTSRRYRQLLTKITKSLYSPADAISLLPKIANANFVETVDLHISLGLDPKYADQQLSQRLFYQKA